MYAVVTTGGKQYRVEAGSELIIERLAEEPGASITFDRVLLLGNGEAVTVGSPTVDGASVSGTVLAEELGPKLIIFKFKQKVKYRRTRGHRQHLTRVRIDEINTGDKKADEARKAEEAQKAEEARKAEEATKAEEARKAEEATKAEEARRAEEATKDVVATEVDASASATERAPAKPARTRKADAADEAEATEKAPAKPARTRKTAKPKAGAASEPEADAPAKPATRRRTTKASKATSEAQE